jgi:hypothetical protein
VVRKNIKKIKLLDVTSPDRFSDKMLYEYLIDWCVTKGHIQSIFEGQNLLTVIFMTITDGQSSMNIFSSLPVGK